MTAPGGQTYSAPSPNVDPCPTENSPEMNVSTRSSGWRYDISLAPELQLDPDDIRRRFGRFADDDPQSH